MKRYTVIDERDRTETHRIQAADQFINTPYAVINAETGRRRRHYTTFDEAMADARRRNIAERQSYHSETLGTVTIPED